MWEVETGLSCFGGVVLAGKESAKTTLMAHEQHSCPTATIYLYTYNLKVQRPNREDGEHGIHGDEGGA